MVFPVAAAAEKSGTFVTWEGRSRPFEKVLVESHALPDLRVLAGIADELGTDLGFRTVERCPRRAGRDRTLGRRAPVSTTGAGADATGDGRAGEGGLRLATWKQMIDDGSMLDGDDYLKATGRAAVALVSAGDPRGAGRRRRAPRSP